jgi:class 3 adenylate cyclase
LRLSPVESYAGDSPEPVLLIIADISGYTRYMTANAKTLAHSQTLITELVESMIVQVQAPLEVAKLEGDAIFLFCRQPKESHRWAETRAEISRKLLDFFLRFREKLGEISRARTCTCQACAHLEKLRLKIIVHSGEALFHRVLHFNELAGADVIIVHRLLKNSVPAAQYLLLTEAARRELQFPATMTFKSNIETYEDIGRVKMEFHDFSFDAAPGPAASPNTFGTRYRASLRLYLKLWFGPLASGRGTFRNLPAGCRWPARAGFAALTVLLAPLFLPVAAGLIMFHALKPST